MAVSPQCFPPRKRRPSAGAFISPKLTDVQLIQSLLLLSQEISNLSPLQYLLKLNSLSIIRKLKLLSVLFDELSRNRISRFPPSALLCFEEMHITLRRIKTLIEDCASGSRMWLLMNTEMVAYSFHELKLDISTLLDVFPAKEVDLNEDVVELVNLIRKQCVETKVFLDPDENDLKLKVLSVLDRIKKEIVPEHSDLSEIFEKLGLSDSASCRDELEYLEDEFRNQINEQSKEEVISLIGLVRYSKCVLFGASTPVGKSGEVRRLNSSSELNFPVDFRCPITLDLMMDPVVVATGQTYDRKSINLWIESGHDTCPKTGQKLKHTDLIPNRAMKSLIALWCREQKIPFETTEFNNERYHGVKTNKTALEATKMTVKFLINKLSTQSPDTTNRIIHELRVLAKTDSDNRACIAEAGAIPMLVRHLGSDNPSLQINAVTTILNLSILQVNKERIVETDGALNGVIEVLRSGASWEAKGNAAATIYSLSSVHAYRKALGRKTRVIRGLVDLAKHGPQCSKKDALLAMLNLAGDREAVGKLIESGIMDMAREVMDGLPEETVTVIEVVVKRGGLLAVIVAYSVIKKLAALLRNGSDRAKESSAATLVTICRRGGSDMVTELAGLTGIERIIWEMMGSGTVRGRRKAASLLRILRRWAAGLDHHSTTVAYSANINASSAIVLPASAS